MKRLSWPLIDCRVLSGFATAWLIAMLATTFLHSAVYAKQVALLVGSSEYNDGGIPGLPFCRSDVQRLGQSLKQNAGFTEIYTPGFSNSAVKVKRGQAMAAIRQVAKKLKKEDTFLFYFTGHGFMDVNGKGYLATSDTNLSRLGKTAWPLDGPGSLKQALGSVKARNIIVIIDACRDQKGKSLSRKFVASTIELVNSQSDENSYNLMLSCSSGEQSWSLGNKSMSAFTSFLIHGLENLDGVVTASRLAEHAEQQTQKWAKQNKHRQNPIKFTSGPLLILKDVVPPPINRPLIKINPKDGAEMIFVPTGSFLRGTETGNADEKPQRRLELDGFWIYKHEVTTRQYRMFCQATGHAMPSSSFEADDKEPINKVSWEDARAYALWAGVRLPTEAEWEKAARGTQGRKYPWGAEWEEWKVWSMMTWTRQNGAPVDEPVSGASPYGVLNMSGNVWEWCADWYDPNFYQNSPNTNPLGPLEGTERVIRGGSRFNTGSNDFRATRRKGLSPSNAQNVGVGFRCASSD